MKFANLAFKVAKVPLGLKTRDSETFDRAGDHVIGLLGDACSLFGKRSWATATFVAVTAIEETAKAESMVYRHDTSEPPNRNDPMRRHVNKHVLAVRDTTFMGRLQEALGEERCRALLHEATEGGLVTLREASIYADVSDGELIVPGDTISKERAREIVLLALEVADDLLVGCTSHSMEVWSPTLNELFASIIESE